MNCRYPLAGPASTPPLISERASSSTSDGPFLLPPAGRTHLLARRWPRPGRRDAGHHLRQLDGNSGVVDEVDEHGQLRDRQPEGDGHPDVRHEVAMRPRADGDQHQRRVDERGHKRAQRQLECLCPG